MRHGVARSLVVIKGVRGCHPGNFCKFPFKILPSGATSGKKLASVGMQNGTVKREKLVLH